MLAIDLTLNREKIEDHLKKITKLKSQEFLYIRLGSLESLLAADVELIRFATELTNEVAISVEHEDVKNIHLSQIFRDFNVKTVSIRVKTNPEKFGQVYNLGTENSGDRDIYFSIKQKIAECPPGKEVALEFSDESDFRMVGSTLALLHETGVKWAVLNPSAKITDDLLRKYRELFDFLRMRRCYKLYVYFDFLSPQRWNWQMQTLNTFSGLREVHMDISNKCTHSCIFCGLYSPKAMEQIQKSGDENIISDVRKFMRAEIDGQKALDIIKSLPVDVEIIQLGGAGDPLMHPKAIDLIVAIRERAFRLEILSNMEYLSLEKVELISSLGSSNDSDITFIVNLSGGTAETYVKTRPKQNEKSFNKITENLKLFSKLKEKNKKGVQLVLMCVVNTVNVAKLKEVAEYALQVGADAVWYKPMELHAEYMKEILPTSKDHAVLKAQIKESLEFLDQNKINVFMRDYCERIIGQ